MDFVSQIEPYALTLTPPTCQTITPSQFTYDKTYSFFHTIHLFRAYGGVALSLGLLLYGYKVMKTIGFKLTALSPTRGSSASLASSLMVATASYIGIPVSSTQCIVGGIAGIGLVEGKNNVQWKHLGKCVIGWVLVFFTATIFSAMLFAVVAYSPSLNC